MRPISQRRGVVHVEVVIAGFAETGATLRDIADAIMLIQQAMREDSKSVGEKVGYDDFVKVKINKAGDLVFRYKTQVAER